MKSERHLLMLLLFTVIGCSSAPKKVAANQSIEPPPKLLAPSVRRIWIPPHLKDGGQEWEEGHFVYKIERNSSFSR